MCELAQIDILCLDETKLTYDFTDAQLGIKGYQHPPLRRDRPIIHPCSFGGGKLVYIKDGLITNRLKNFETPNAETICIELIIANRKWFIMFAYRPESIGRHVFLRRFRSH